MAHQVLMPRLGVNSVEATVVRWCKARGEQVEKGDVIAEIDTDKAVFELEAEASGILRHISVEAGQTVGFNTPLAIIAGPDEEIEEFSTSTPAGGNAPAARIREINERVFDSAPATAPVRPRFATPKALALAEARSIPLAEVERLAAASPRGLVTERDLEDYLALTPTLIYGASTGAKQIFTIIRSGRPHRIVGIVDDSPAKQDRSVYGVPVVGGIEALAERAAHEKIGVLVASHSDNRRKILKKLKEKVPDVELPPAVDARAMIGPDVEIGEAVLIEAGCVLGHEVAIKDGAILNIGAKMSHNCSIGECSHIAIGAALSGSVSVGDNCFLGAGCAVGPEVEIGDNAIVTPGSAVVTNIPAGMIAAGNPATVIGTSKRGHD